MDALSLVISLLIVCFGFVVFFGAPYLPTLSKQVNIALDMADLRPGQTLLELGSGDGKVMLAAARRGWRVVGYELNPILCLVAWLRTWHYRKEVTIICGNFWTKQWPAADAIFVFLLPKYMSRLDAKIERSMPGHVKLVSFAFAVPDKQPAANMDGVFLYTYASDLQAAPESATISIMKGMPKTPRTAKPDQRGEVSVLLLPLVLAILLFVGAAGFAMWAYTSREDYRTNTEAKISVAVKEARRTEDIAKDKEHAEADKQPLKTYAGPEQYGSLKVGYPKTWSGYVVTSSNSPLDGYFHPGIVPAIDSTDSLFALHVQVLNTPYKTVVNSLSQSTAKVPPTSTPFSFPKVSKVVGIRFDGQFDPNSQANGSMIVIPLRDKTLQVSTDSPLYAADFNNNIIPNFTFSP